MVEDNNKERRDSIHVIYVPPPGIVMYQVQRSDLIKLYERKAHHILMGSFYVCMAIAVAFLTCLLAVPSIDAITYGIFSCLSGVCLVLALVFLVLALRERKKVKELYNRIIGKG